MQKQLSWKIGGQQGEGIESAGEILASTLNRLGYYLYGYRQFSSRIKGGHTDNKLRISVSPLAAISDTLEILVAFDQETLDVSAKEVGPNGVIIADAAFSPIIATDSKALFCAVNLTALSKQTGDGMRRNVVALGATAAVLGLAPTLFEDTLEEWYHAKGEVTVSGNTAAFRAGYLAIQEQHPQAFHHLQLAPGDGQPRLFIIGNEAIALGAIAGGCRFLSAYPITPSSEIMEYMIKHLPALGGIAVQTEDEISACTMAIGAAYAGARAMTASSGPGLSLKAEAIGLAGMTETPLVVINTQRGGPSTGLPTKHEQSDLLAMLFSTHGEIPKIILAPSTVEEAFYDAAEAFNLAEEYQCPVILLSDLQLSLGLQTAEPYDLSRVQIRRGKLATPADLPELSNPDYFKRYAPTPDGISIRPLPGMKYGIHHATGLEHADTGKPFEGVENRKQQTEKRLRKTQSLPNRFAQPVWTDTTAAQADVLLVGMGSTRGVISEAAQQLRENGLLVHQAHLRLLWPFPAEQLAAAAATAQKIIIVENNATGQLARLIKMELPQYSSLLYSVLKYDGTPFTPAEIFHQSKELI